ncbi:Cytidylate kinase [Ecytonucleospora hepatopenaei]|uniref:(d)CMP kinase n=1 Tax=Ecytonucleospora hepatopenaei TaxID=646526 RepID=A0A1W0E719_9MICR|nr:Cytidylate kinase [Ecytonucleospora hepatopenaei]
MLIQIAIDGPCASGKSTIAALIAEKYGFYRVDSGLFYRGITVVMLENNCVEREEIILFLPKLRFKLFKNSLFNNGKNISEACRDKIVDKNVSFYASILEVRKYVNKVIEDYVRMSDKSFIIDGRDIGSVVLPNADIKFYLTSSSKTRAERRVREREGCSLEETLKFIEDRDFKDINRKYDPLVCVKEAIIIKNDFLSLEETLEEFCKHIDNFIKKKSI